MGHIQQTMKVVLDAANKDETNSKRQADLMRTYHVLRELSYQHSQDSDEPFTTKRKPCTTKRK